MIKKVVGVFNKRFNSLFNFYKQLIKKYSLGFPVADIKKQQDMKTVLVVLNNKSLYQIISFKHLAKHLKLI
jgi:hypothetical protein